MFKSHALVVIVDDDVFERMGASYMFSDAGYRVLEAENADEALQLFEQAMAAGMNDFLSELFVKRSSEMLNHPPESWDGVFTMTKK